MTAGVAAPAVTAIVVPTGDRPTKQDRPLPQFAVKGGLFFLVEC